MTHILTELVFLPLLGAMIVLLMPRKIERAVFAVGTAVSGAAVFLSCLIFKGFDLTDTGFQYAHTRMWIPSFNVRYSVGIDGMSLVLICLTTFLTFIALFASSFTIRERKKEFVASALFLESAMLGTFAALDVFLFYVFWEAMLVPMYLLIGIFGGPRRIYATLKFFLYTMAGSVLMLLALLLIYWEHFRQYGVYSTSIVDLYKLSFPLGAQLVLFSMFLVAFAIKIPMFPFHTWLPDAHVEAPTFGSVVLAGVLLKMGGYGMLRFAIPLFPSAAQEFAPWLGWFGVIGIVYGAYVAMAQQDIKKLVAYSSVSHMGFVVLGMASLSVLGIQGAMFQMVAHGVSTGALFLLVGILYERRHTRMIVDYGGIAKVAPRLSAAFLVITLASVGLPGLCGFIGEFMVLAGSFGALVLKHPAWMVGVSVIGIVLGAAYMLRMYENVFLGEVKLEENKKLPDLRWYEGAVLAVPLIAAIWLGVRPNTVLDYLTPSAQKIVERMHPEKLK